jgi:protein phosphatase
VIYRGIPQQLGGLSLSSVVEREPTLISSLPVYSQQQLADGITVDNLRQARDRVRILREQAAACQRPTQPVFCRDTGSTAATSTTPSTSTSPSGSPVASKPGTSRPGSRPGTSRPGASRGGGR